MVQLRISPAHETSTVQTVRRFPCLIGRGAAADVRIEQPGVWDRHLQLELQRNVGIVANLLPGALATLNGQPLERGFLRNGDVIELGATKLQFWLSPTRQRSVRWREHVTWIALALVCAAQICLVYVLLR